MHTQTHKNELYCTKSKKPLLFLLGVEKNFNSSFQCAFMYVARHSSFANFVFIGWSIKIQKTCIRKKPKYFLKHRKNYINKGIKLDVCFAIKSKQAWGSLNCKIMQMLCLSHLILFSQKRFVKMEQSLSGFSVKRLKEHFMHWNSIKKLTLNKMVKLFHKMKLEYVSCFAFFRFYGELRCT